MHAADADVEPSEPTDVGGSTSDPVYDLARVSKVPEFVSTEVPTLVSIPTEDPKNVSTDASEPVPKEENADGPSLA
jgi:hypothetical protein